MIYTETQDLKEVICELLGTSKYFSDDLSVGPDDMIIDPISPDGSTRRFFRISRGGKSVCLAVLPGGCDEMQMNEAMSVFFIGSHLYQSGARVPQIYGREKGTGLVLFEDLGDVRLHDKICLSDLQRDQDRTAILELYKGVINSLLVMQFEGIKGFDPSWCWDTTHYNKEVMLERESGYFTRAFLQNYLGLEVPGGLKEEFDELSSRAGQGDMITFLHRDFQSRNIMVKNGEPYFIDFQGGRIGPPGYDLASLLADPYAALPETLQQQLYGYYLERIIKIKHADQDEFIKTFPYLRLQRQLQIVGAYSFLYKEKKKNFFKHFIVPAVNNLQALLDDDTFSMYPVLRGITGRAQVLFGQ